MIETYLDNNEHFCRMILKSIFFGDKQ